MFEDLFLGYAIGDAFGAGVAFQDRYWIRKNVDFSQLVNVRSKIRAKVPDPEMFSKNYQARDYSDDTEMTIGTTRALLSGQPFSEKLLIDYGTQEYLSGIVTGILGGRYRLKALPPYMLQKVEGVKMLRELATQFHAW